MRAVLQRVSEASVRVDGEIVAQIGPGLLALVGVTPSDGPAQAAWLADKIANLRVFADAEGKMNLSVSDTGGGVLVVSNFTLYGDAQKGRRPSFLLAARPEQAEPLYLSVAAHLQRLGLHAPTGRFGADMKVALVNDGPITLVLDTP